MNITKRLGEKAIFQGTQVISPNRSWCTQQILDLVNWSPSSLPRKDILWLVPSRQAAEFYQEHSLTAEKPGTGIFLPDIKLLPAWTDEVYRRMGDSYALVEDRIREVIIQRLVEKSPYLTGSSFPGVVSKIAQFVVQVKRNNLSMEQLTKKIHTFNRQHNRRAGLSEKDKFLLELLYNYQEFLRKKNYIDREDTALWVSETLKRKEAGLTNYLAGYKVLVLDGFYYLTPSQQALIQEMIDFVPDTIVSLHANPANVAGSQTAVSISEGYNSFISKISGRCELVKRPSPSVSTPQVLFHDPADRVEEIRKIARGIKGALLENPQIPADRVAVVFPSLDIYKPLINEIFPQYGIPYQLQFPLSGSPLAQVFKKLLDLRCEGFLLDDLEEFFSIGFISPQFTQQGRAEFFDSLGLEKYDVLEFDFPYFTDLGRKANISGGVDFIKDWLEPLRKYLNGKARSEYTDTKAAWANAANSLFYLKQLYTLLWRLPDTLTPADFQNSVQDLVNFMHIPQNLISTLKSDGHEGQRNLAALGRIKDILGETALHLRFMGDTKYPLALFRKLYLRYMTRSEFSIPGQGKNITIMDLSETGGISFDILFMGGLVEGELPYAREQNIFYPAGVGKFFDRPDRSQESKYLFSGLLNNCRGPVYLFAPKASDDKVLYVSSLIDPTKLERMEVSDTIYSQPELINHVALNRLYDQDNILSECDPEILGQIKRVRKMEESRSSLEPSAYAGYLNDPENLVRLYERFTYSADNHCHYSVSQLEEYARCPMQYFMDRILRLCPVPEITEEMEADERGKLVHKILEKYYLDISDAELADKDALRQRLKQTADRVFNKWSPPYYSAFWEVERRKLLSGMDGTDKPGILLHFWHNEQEQLQYSRPVMCEFAFGEENDHFCVDDIHLVGRIDRVDLLVESKSFLFFDYKTGKIPDLEDINKGLSFQLPVYLMALADHFKKDSSGLATGAGGYYAVGEKGGKIEVKIKAFYGNASVEDSLHSKTRKNRFYNDSDLDEQFHSIRNRIRAIDQDIKDGKFPLPQNDPKDIPCKWCDFKKICRYQAEASKL